MSINLAEKKLQNEQIYNFSKYFTPNKNNQGKERNFNNWTCFIANYFGNNRLLDGVIENNIINDNYVFKDLATYKYHIAGEGSDCYITPNLFPSKSHVKRTENYVTWLTSLYIDIDGISGITSPEKALDKLYNACDKLDIPYPSIVVHTSTNPTVHFQAYWLIDPIYIKNNNYELNKKLKKNWKDGNEALSVMLQDIEPDFNIDLSVSSDIARYMRIPGTINQKTKEYAYILDTNITDKRYLLSDPWCYNLIGKYYKYKNNNYIYRKKSNIKLLDHEQFKAILDNGVPKDYRNKAHYALTKACWVDGLGYKDTLDVIKDFNKRCNISERRSQIISAVNGAYKGTKGLDISIICELANIAVNDDVFSPDKSILRIFNDLQGKTMSKTTFKQYNAVKKVTDVINRLFNQGYNYLLTQKQLALLAQVNYNTLKIYFNRIIENLQKENIYLDYDYSNKRYKLLSFKDKAKELLNRVKKYKHFSLVENINNLNKLSTGDMYINPLYSIRGVLGGETDCLSRGSP